MKLYFESKRQALRSANVTILSPLIGVLEWVKRLFSQGDLTSSFSISHWK
jgi:hypothetical protein